MLWRICHRQNWMQRFPSLCILGTSYMPRWNGRMWLHISLLMWPACFARNRKACGDLSCWRVLSCVEASPISWNLVVSDKIPFPFSKYSNVLRDEHNTVPIVSLGDHHILVLTHAGLWLLRDVDLAGILSGMSGLALAHFWAKCRSPAFRITPFLRPPPLVGKSANWFQQSSNSASIATRFKCWGIFLWETFFFVTCGHLNAVGLDDLSKSAES